MEKNKQSVLKIGELLAREGFIKQANLEKALEVQKIDYDAASVPLGQVLIEKGFINEDQLKMLLKHQETQHAVGALAIEKGLVDEEMLVNCLKKMQPGDDLGKMLVMQGCISTEELAALDTDKAEESNLGELAVKLEMISRKDLNEALKQKRSQRTIGEILCDMKMVTPENLNHVLRKHSKQMRIGDFLLKEGIISEEKLKAALYEQRHRSEPLGNILIKKKLITPSQLYSVLSRQYNIPFRKLTEFEFEETQRNTLTRIIGPKYAEKNMIMPLAINDDVLTLAMFNPDNIRIAQELKPVYSNFKMDSILISESKFYQLFESLYGRPVTYRREFTEEVEPEEEEEVDITEIDLEEVNVQDDRIAPYGMGDMEGEEIVNFIVKYGIVHGASDIHIEQDRSGARLRFRIDGMLQLLKLRWLEEKFQTMVPAVISRIKVMSNLDIAERRIPQDGVFRINYYDKEKLKKVDLDFRVATCPAIVGENVSIRILDARNAFTGLEELGHSPHILEALKRMVKSSAGMFLVSGPTGSGKSSTLYAALQYVYNPGIKIITAEDPIEYSFPGIMQTQIHQKINLTFSRLLRSFLRLDPDVILVGEMRDEETATIGFDAAQTGHLLLSTIHTNDAISAVTRLLDLKVEYNQIASSLMGVLAQRLIRRICPECKKRYIPPKEQWRLLYKKYPSNLTFYKADGCDRCDFTGYHGRMLISELFSIEGDVASALNRGASEYEIKQIALESGMKTMLDDGISKLNDTTLSEIIRVVPHEMLKEFRARQTDSVTSPENPENGFDNGTVTPFHSGIVINDPVVQEKIITNMYEEYKMLHTDSGNGMIWPDPSLFNEFVSESHRNICAQYHCEEVSFYLKKQNDKIGIYAQPAKV
ncbi:MAG: Flp pilus assembly complex ATPase component TadA [Desulfobacterales bacterium]|nr:Flp pilus assembly complex ATPase component TadA [Desulfobacterales bacterium]